MDTTPQLEDKIIKMGRYIRQAMTDEDLEGFDAVREIPDHIFKALLDQFEKPFQS